MTPRRWQLCFMAIGTVLTGLFLLFFLGEGLMRLTRPDLVPSNQLKSIPDPFIGWRYLPCQDIEGRTEHGEYRHNRVNSLGFPDTDHNLVAATNTLRIAFLGDSFTAAAGVDFESSFVSVTRRLLQLHHPHQQIETLNFSQPSFGTVNEYLAWKHAAAPFSPKVVILAFFLGNDVSDNLPKNKKNGMNSPKYDLVGGRLQALPFAMSPPGEDYDNKQRNWLYRKFLAPSLLYQQYKLLERDGRARFNLGHRRRLQASDAENPFWKRSYAPLDWQVYLRDPGPEFEKGWQITEALLLQLQEEVRAAKAQFHVALLPGVESMDPSRFYASFPKYPGIEKFQFDLDWPRRRLSEFLDAHKISFIDLTAEFSKRPGGLSPSRFYFKFDPHFSVQGHLAAGQAIARFLETEIPRQL